MKKIKLLMSAFILLFATSALAEGWYAGVGLGLADPSSDLDSSGVSWNSAFSFNLHAGYALTEWSFGLAI